MIPLNLSFSVVSLLAVAYVLYIFATLSRRLGAVTKMKPHYRGFYIALGLIAVSLVVSLLPPPAAETDRGLYAAVYHVPLILAGVISLVVAYRYWGWLFRERIQ